MDPVNGLLTRLRDADDDYAKALKRSDELRRRRDDFVLRATLAGATRADIGRTLGITRARAQQLVERARRS